MPLKLETTDSFIACWKQNRQRRASETGRQELLAMATQYYKVTHDAIRRYDKHHLILGDRYEANAALSIEIFEAARKYVDVLSFQDFREPVKHLSDLYAQTNMPLLWADGAKGIELWHQTIPDKPTYANR